MRRPSSKFVVVATTITVAMLLSVKASAWMTTNVPRWQGAEPTKQAEPPTTARLAARIILLWAGSERQLLRFRVELRELRLGIEDLVQALRAIRYGRSHTRGSIPGRG